MVMLIAGGSLSTGSHDPYCGTLMPLGPSTPSVGLSFPPNSCDIAAITLESRRSVSWASGPIVSGVRTGLSFLSRLGRAVESPLPALPGRAKGEQPLHVPRHGHKAPLAPDTVDPAQQKLPEAHHRFDDAKHRLRNLFAQGIEFPALWRLQPVRHGLNRRGILRRQWRIRKALGQRRVMRLAPHRDHRLDLRHRTGRHIRRAEITIVRQYRLNLAQLIAQGCNLLQHRLKLLLVVGRLHHINSY